MVTPHLSHLPESTQDDWTPVQEVLLYQGRIQRGFGRTPWAPKTTHCSYVLIWLGQTMIFGQQNPSLTKILTSRVVLKGVFTHLGKI